MRRDRWTRGVAVVAAIVAGAVGFREAAVPDPPAPTEHRGSPFISPKSLSALPSVISYGEDPGSRERWEWMMLRDPASGSIPPNIRARELAFARTLPIRDHRLAKGPASRAVTWNARGPFNVGGRTRALAYDRQNTNVILAGGVSGGMMRSTDAGDSWTRVGPINDLQSVTCIVQDPRPGRSAIWYYGTGELRGNSAAGPDASVGAVGLSLYRGDGVFRSTDNGLTWNVLPSTRTGNVLFDQAFDYVWNLALDPSDTTRTVLVAATIGGVRTSTDGGTTWSARLGGADIPAGPRYTDVVVSATGVFYATCSSRNSNGQTTAPDAGLWRSTDGWTWTSITPVGFPADVNRVVAAVAPSNESTVYFVGEAPAVMPTGHGIWKYTYLGGDGSGLNGLWADRSANLPNEIGLAGNAVFGTQSSYDLVAAVHPTDPNTLFVGAINLYRDTTAFATPGRWVRIGGYATKDTYNRYPENHPDHHALVFQPGLPNTLLNGNDGGIFRTDNARATSVAWTSLNNGYTTTQFYAIAIDPSTIGNVFLVGGMQDNGTWFSTNAGLAFPWVEAAGGDGGFCVVEPGATRVTISLQNGVVYRTSFQNGAMTAYARIDPSGGSGYLFIAPLASDPSQPTRLYLASGTTVWRNNDLAQIPLDGSQNASTSASWKNLTQTSVGSSARITALAASTTPANRLYYGTSDARLFKLINAHLDASTPVDIGTGKGFPAGGYVASIAVDPVNADHVVIAFSNYAIPSVFATNDGGSTWSDVSGNLEASRDGSGNGPSVRWIAMLPDSSAYYYFAGTSVGLFSSRQLTDTSTVWTQEAPAQIGSHVVTMIQARRSDGLVAVGTHGGGTFTASIPVVSPPPPPSVPTAYAVSHNWPNPFNAGTSFTITTPSTGFVRVRIVDMTGRTVATVFERTVPSGTHPASWDGRTMDGRPASSGVYFSVLEASGTIAAKKMMLIR